VTDGAVRVERVLPAAPDVVFDAWTDPDSLRVWMAPGERTVADAECDPRVGGGFRIVMISDDGAMEHTGRYLELDRPSRLVFTWRSAGTDMVDTEVTVDLAELDAGTRMVITHRGLASEQARDNHRGGWSAIADKIAQALGEPSG
jgi:uncharacterized protein YndB with AHSA1/START domain